MRISRKQLNKEVENMTKEYVKEALNMIMVLGANIASLKEELTSIDTADDGLFDTLDALSNCEVSAKEAYEEIRDYYSELEDGGFIKRPHLDIDPETLQVMVSQSANGYTAIAKTSAKDDNTHQPISLQLKPKQGVLRYFPKRYTDSGPDPA